MKDIVSSRSLHANKSLRNVLKPYAVVDLQLKGRPSQYVLMYYQDSNGIYYFDTVVFTFDKQRPNYIIANTLNSTHPMAVRSKTEYDNRYDHEQLMVELVALTPLDALYQVIPVKLDEYTYPHQHYDNEMIDALQNIVFLSEADANKKIRELKNKYHTGIDFSLQELPHDVLYDLIHQARFDGSVCMLTHE